MTERRFNLVDEPWLPVAGHGRASLREVFSRGDLAVPGGSVLEKIAVFKLLQAVAQAACTPRDDNAWQALAPEGLGAACLTYLEKWRNAFWLYGERPFLQFPAVAGAKLLPYSALMPDVAIGNSSVLFQSQIGREPDDAERALLLLVQMSCCFSGKKADTTVTLSPGTVKSASAKAGPALCSRGLLHSFFMGNSIRESVWFNLLTREDVAGDRTLTQGLGIPPWESMPQGENDAVAHALRYSLMGRLVPLARFCLLEDSGVRCVEGIQHPDYLHGGMIDPSVAADFRKAKPRVIWADPSRRPWRALTSLLSFLSHSQAGDFICPQLKWCAARLRRPGLAVFRLWSGGIRLSSNAGEQYLTGDDDMVESEISLHADWFDREGSDWFDALQNAMGKVEQMGKTVYASVFGYYKEAKADNAENCAKRAAREFWQIAERFFPALSQACAEPDRPEGLEATLDHMKACVWESYANACPRDTARQLQLWVRHSPRLSGGRKTTKGDWYEKQ